ncbi:hypothetical protein [Kitasatospora sp. NPDC005751]|uniref:hypothetical protein n=1 Tax=Kitasatospora sp. NPDC005751 TaxID=3157064 RepID=UPI0033DB0458
MTGRDVACRREREHCARTEGAWYSFKYAQNRQPVGPELLHGIAEANAVAEEADGW